MAIKDVTISQNAISVSLSNIVVQSIVDVSDSLIGSALELAKRAGVTSYIYTGDQLTSIAYADFEGVTGHSKTLTYSGDNISSTSESYAYENRDWTYNVSFTYTGNKLTAKSATLTIT